MSGASRRTFLRQSALAGGSFFISKSLTSCGGEGGSTGANDVINVAVVGFRGRGAEHIKSFSEIKGVRVAALCDVNTAVLAKQADAFKAKGQEVQTYQDIRKLLENKDIDAISIATPNHWHALAGIWAMQAGKDVYVEKPVSHNVWEGRQLVNAARKYNRIVQTGSQIRSSQGIRDAVQWVKAGNLGKITIARGLCYKRRKSIGKARGPLETPEGVDLDLWFGPAPVAPIHRKKLDYDWHWQWAYGNGDLGNQGVHQVDIARWFLGENEIAPRTWSVGGRLGYEDDGETPNTQIIYQAYATAPLIFEVRGLPKSRELVVEKGAEKSTEKIKDGADMDNFMGGQIGVVIHCEGGHVLVPNYDTAIAYDKSGKELKKWEGDDNHFENFIKGVRSRKREDLTAEVLEGHISAALCHTANISHQLGTKKSVDEIKQAISADAGAGETLDRMLGHLQANGIDLNATPLTLGPVLNFDPKTEKAVGNEAAAKLLTREYRAPFVVPEIAV
jgi:predicted dehydrogenase